MALEETCAIVKTSLRILFFEDHQDDIDLSLLALSASEFEVTADVAMTTEEFLDRVRSTYYDVILSDYRMPGANGMDIYQVMRSEGLNIPFILVTGSLGDEKAVECVKEGVADYVLKDRLVRLPMAIRRALEERRLRRDRANAEEALRRSEHSYRSLVEGAPCGIFRVSEDGRFLDVNPALLEMLCYDSESELRNCDEVFVDAGARASFMAECVRRGRIEDAEVVWKRKDGVAITVQLKGRLVWDENWGVCFEIIAENISERKRADERIRQLNRLYSVLTHVSQSIVRIRNRDELFGEICRILVEDGRFRMAWVGLVDEQTSLLKPVAQWGHEEHYLENIRICVAEEREGRGPTGSALRKGCNLLCDDIETDARMLPWRNEALRRGYRSSGAFPLTVQGRTLGAVTMYATEAGFFDAETVALLDELASDVAFALENMETERLRQRAVNELDQFFALSLDMLCIAGMDGCIRRVNAACEKTLGYSGAELASRSLFDLVHPGDRAAARDAFQKLAAGAELNQTEVRFLSKDGTYKWLLCNATPVEAQGLVFAAACDITNRKLLEEQLRAQNIELEEQNRQVNAANRMKSEFLANMSHELRSPLNGIIGFTELMYDGKVGPLPEKPRELLARILKSGRHLLHLISDVLDLSKVETGRLDLEPLPLSLTELVQEVSGILGGMAAERQIRVKVYIDPEVNRVVADAGRLKQVLYNYVSNAIKFSSERGSVLIRVSPEGASEFRLEVSDTGIGIQEADIGRLFVEFQQLDASISKRYPGTGLGLALTKRVVESQGGRVGVHSKAGEGSTFYAVLPRNLDVECVNGGRPRILVIEDERVELMVLSSILRDAGCTVDYARTYAAGLAKCREESFDAITLDLLLPDAAGWELLAAIRATERNCNTAVIVVSMVDEPAPALDNIQGRVTKPIGRDEVVRALLQAGVPLPSAQGSRI